jgi:hypothetical protein
MLFCNSKFQTIPIFFRKAGRKSAQRKKLINHERLDDAVFVRGGTIMCNILRNLYP